MIIYEIREIIKRVRNNEEKAFLIFVDGLGGYPLNIPAKTKRANAIFPTSTTPFLFSFYTEKLPEHHTMLEWFTRHEDNIVIPLIGKDHKGNIWNDMEIEESIFSILEDEGISTQHVTQFPEHVYSKAWENTQTLKTLSQLYHLPEKEITFVNWGNLDFILHKYGPYSEAFQQEVETLEQTIKRLRKKLPPDIRIYVFGDHGLIKSSEKVFLPSIEGNLPVGGERVAFYQLSYDEVNKALGNLDSVIVLNEEELESVLGFPINKEINDKYGRTAVIAKKGHGFNFPYFGSTNLYGHGGLSKEERKILIYML